MFQQTTGKAVKMKAQMKDTRSMPLQQQRGAVVACSGVFYTIPYNKATVHCKWALCVHWSFCICRSVSFSSLHPVSPSYALNVTSDKAECGNRLSVRHCPNPFPPSLCPVHQSCPCQSLIRIQSTGATRINIKLRYEEFQTQTGTQRVLEEEVASEMSQAGFIFPQRERD